MLNFDRFMDPIIFGDYPLSMRNYLGARLPKFTKKQKTLIKGSYDWIGFNHYSTQYAYHTNQTIDNDSGVGFTRMLFSIPCYLYLYRFFYLFIKK